jgi:hypothetical protein
MTIKALMQKIEAERLAAAKVANAANASSLAAAKSANPANSSSASPSELAGLARLALADSGPENLVLARVHTQSLSKSIISVPHNIKNTPRPLANANPANPANSSEPSSVLNGWRASVETASPPQLLLELLEKFETLRTASLTFLDSGFALDAVHHGWDELQLFAVHKGSEPIMRVDAYGLVPMLAWSGLGLVLLDVDAGHATVTTRSGSLLRQPRLRAGHSAAVPWWEHSLFNAGGGPCASA